MGNVTPITEARTMKLQKDMIDEGIGNNEALLEVLRKQAVTEKDSERKKMLAELIVSVQETIGGLKKELKRIEDRGGER
jgi:DNA-directed RNA polymerase specialized sigma54-like protein